MTSDASSPRDDDTRADDTQVPSSRPGSHSSDADSILARLASTGSPVPRVQLARGDDGDVLPLPVTTRGAKRYEQLGEIARGGVGIVMRARDRDIGRDVALKVLRPEHLDHPELIQRFVEEAQIGGQLQHPGIVPVYELGLQDDGRPYFTMKRVKGRTFAARLAARRSPHDDLGAMLSIFGRVCRTLAYAHARGVLHRDLKPANIMIGAFGEVQVVDWGLAKVLPQGGIHDEARARRSARDGDPIETVRSGTDAHDSLTGSVLGTPAYMAPEQARGEVDRLDERVDVFALGSMLCEIITGAPAYTGESLEMVRRALAADLDEAWARLDAADHDPELIELARTCLAARPMDRPAHAGEVSAHFDTYRQSVANRAHVAALATQEARAETARREREVAEERARAEAAERQTEAAEARAVAARRRRRQTSALSFASTALVILGVLAGLWIARDRRSMRQQTSRTVENLLARASNAERAQDWETAVRAAEEAVGFAGSNVGTEALRTLAEEERDRLARLRDARNASLAKDARDRRVVALLDEVRALRFDGEGNRSWEALYARAFAEYGIDLDTTSRGDLVALLGTSVEARRLAAGLDAWGTLRYRHRAPGHPRGEHLLHVADLIDPHPVRSDLRAVLLGSPASLLDARVAAAERTPPRAETALLMSDVLAALHREEEALALLVTAWMDPGRAPDTVVDPAVRAEMHVALAHLFMAPPHREPHRALDHILAARALRPRSAAVLVRLAMIYRLLGQTTEAGFVLDKAESLKTAAPWVALERGTAWLEAGEPAKALEAFKRAARSEETLALAHVGRAQALHTLGRPEDALGALETARALEPNLPALQEELGIALALRGADAMALAALERAGRQRAALGHRAPSRARGDAANGLLRQREALAERFLARGQVEAALNMWREVVRLDPDRVPILVAMAWQLALLEKPTKTQLDEALALAKRAAQLAPDEGAAHGALGIVHHARGEAEDSRRAFRRALPRSRTGRPDAARDHLGYARAALSADQIERANLHMRRARSTIQDQLRGNPALQRLWREMQVALGG